MSESDGACALPHSVRELEFLRIEASKQIESLRSLQAFILAAAAQPDTLFHGYRPSNGPDPRRFDLLEPHLQTDERDLLALNRELWRRFCRKLQACNDDIRQIAPADWDSQRRYAESAELVLQRLEERIVAQIEAVEQANARVSGSVANEKERQTQSRKKRSGRPKADYQTEQAEAELAADWKRAKESGTYKPDFARDHGMSPEEFELMLGRVRKRKGSKPRKRGRA